MSKNMMSNKGQSKADRSDAQSSLNLDAVHRRFAKAFPELSRCFSWLNGGYAAGAEWEPLVAAYRARLSDVRTERLQREAHDALHFGLVDENDFAVLVSFVLGLDPAIMISESETPKAVLARFEQIDHSRAA